MIGDSALLDAWEDACTRAGWMRPLVLAAAVSGGAASELAHMPLGTAGARLLPLAARFGDEVEGVWSCASCGARLDVSLPLRDLGGPGEPDEGTFVVSDGEWAVTARLPTPADLAAAAARSGDVDGAEQEILARCVLAAGTPDGPASIEVLPAAVLEAVAEQMQARDPLALVSVRVTCPECSDVGEAVLDLGAWCWDETDAYVRRLVADVARLAAAWGWSERDVVSLGPVRRAWYVEMAP